MRSRSPSDPEIPDLEPGPRPSTLPGANAIVQQESDFEAQLERSPSLPPEPASWVGDWAEYSGTEPPRSASTPPPRTSGFVRVQPERAESMHVEAEYGESARVESRRPPLTPELPRLSVPAASLGSALGPGLLLVGASALLTLVDQRTLTSQSLATAVDSRPPTWVAGVLCVAGLAFLVRGVWRFAEAREG